MAQSTDATGWQKFLVYSYSAAIVMIGWNLLGVSFDDISSYVKNSSVANAATRVSDFRRGKTLRDRTLDTPKKKIVATENDTPQDALTNKDRRELDDLLGKLPSDG
ncbi:MAG: hypothetical protein KDD66_00060 [Bdellovibrionales bacterium]|nr:hypothetical protein [Bdellovibrionales bacterium]